MRIKAVVITVMLVGCKADQKSSYVKTEAEDGPDAEMVFEGNHGIESFTFNGVTIENPPEGCRLKITRHKGIKTTEMRCPDKDGGK